MYRSAQTVRIFLCASLFTGYGLFWALAALHPLLEHDEYQPHCQAEPGTSHIHTPEYGHHSCALCDCTLSSVAELSISQWQLAPQMLDFEAVPNFYFSPACISPLALPALRGPPNRA